MTTPDQQPPHESGPDHAEVAAERVVPAEGAAHSTGQAPTSDPSSMAGVPAGGAATSSARKRSISRSQLAFAAVGLGVGLITGLALGQIEFAQPSNAIPEAVEACGVQDTAGINVGDGGQSISMQSEGTESAGAPYAEVACVLMELETTDSVISKIDGTRALDGRMTGQWDEFSASWGYHPDSGLDIVIEVVETD